MDMSKALGVDLGGVILDWAPYKDTGLAFSSDNYLQTPAVEKVIESLAQLNSGRFQNQVFIISKHDHYGPGRMLEWLDHQDFYTKTGIPRECLIFCTERSEKAEICKKLNIDYFVDDRLEVLSHLVGVVEHLYLFHPSEKEIEGFKEYLSCVTRVESWNELVPLLT